MMAETSSSSFDSVEWLFLIGAIGFAVTGLQRLSKWNSKKQRERAGMPPADAPPPPDIHPDTDTP